MSRRAMDERRPLLRRRSQDQLDSALDTDANGAPLAGGTVLGIHNLAIVTPQFIVCYRVQPCLERFTNAISGRSGHKRNFQIGRAHV